MKKIERYLLWTLGLVSVAFLIFAPWGEVWGRIKEHFFWMAIGGAISEAAFAGGLVIMAASIGMNIRNPFKLRKNLKSILQSSTKTRLFWIGFWTNAVGAIGTGFLILFGIVLVLPVSSWGLAVLAIFDLMVTIALRRVVLGVHARHRNLP